jgi:hypothetical protein
MNMSNDCELNLDELDAIAGGVRNCETAVFAAFVMGVASKCGDAGRQMLANSFGAAQGN